MTIELPSELEERVRQSVESGHYSSVEACVSDALERALPRKSAEPIGDVGAEEPTIGEIIREIWSKLPPEEAAKLPVDGAAEHDHYIYGWPKKGQ